eukprot:565977-Rhodomonas_salina.2
MRGQRITRAPLWRLRHTWPRTRVRRCNAPTASHVPRASRPSLLPAHCGHSIVTCLSCFGGSKCTHDCWHAYMSSHEKRTGITSTSTTSTRSPQPHAPAVASHLRDSKLPWQRRLNRLLDLRRLLFFLGDVLVEFAIGVKADDSNLRVSHDSAAGRMRERD